MRSSGSRLSRFAATGADAADFPAGQQPCVFLRSNCSLIDCCQTGLSLAAEALAFLQRLPASVSLLEIALMSFRRLEEGLCGLSIPAVARRHNNRRPAAGGHFSSSRYHYSSSLAVVLGCQLPDRSAPVWPLEFALIAFRLLPSCIVAVSVA